MWELYMENELWGTCENDVVADPEKGSPVYQLVLSAVHSPSRPDHRPPRLDLYHDGKSVDVTPYLPPSWRYGEDEDYE